MSAHVPAMGRYLDRVYNFSQWVGTLWDDRPRPQIPTAAIWLCAFFLFVFRRGSLNAIESDLRTADVWKQLIRNTPVKVKPRANLIPLLTGP